MALVEAKTVYEFEASAERVFDAWLDPAVVRSWSARSVPGTPSTDVRRVEIDARVGGEFVFSDMREEDGKPVEVLTLGYYHLIDRPRKLVFSWFTSDEEEQENNSVVTLTIEPTGNGCRATMTHAMDVRWAEYVEQTANAWALMLRQVDLELSEGGGGL